MRHLYALTNIINTCSGYSNEYLMNTCIKMMPSLTCNDYKNTHCVMGMWKTDTGKKPHYLTKTETS